MLEVKSFASYVVNNLYDNNFLSDDLPLLLRDAGSSSESADCFHEIKRIFAENSLRSLNEDQLETALINPLLDRLGWYSLSKESKTIQSKTICPDYTLFASKEKKDRYLAMTQQQRKDAVEDIVTICEVKVANKLLDTRKAKRDDNPYLQILEYLSLTRLPFGFLSNGIEWWLVDNEKIAADKRYLSVDLEKIILDDNEEAFHCFFYLFHRTTFRPDIPDEASVFTALNEADAQYRKQSEESLRKVIYGSNGAESLFETTGQALFAGAGQKNNPEVLQQVYENSLYFIFRLLFIAYFEDRHWDLLKKHSHYHTLSLRNLFEDLKKENEQTDSNSFTGWYKLQTLFKILNEGSLNLSIPLLNGGLFDDSQAALLNKPRLMDNATLFRILDDLFTFGTMLQPLRRDFKALSVTQLGAIYESLLEFEFRIANEDMVYIVYETKIKGKKTALEGYFDTYDTSSLKKDKNNTILSSRIFSDNDLYLVGNQNSRKASASFYTPNSLALPLVKRAIDHHLAEIPENMSVLDLRILDNACGSGHLLIESLNYLTECALDRMDNDPSLAKTLAEEKQRIDETLQALGLLEDMEPDEFMVLKRILLKKVLYGVDVQPFAIELAHLSLWIETFIFGTPLSLIEHHVKVGNSLIGTTIKTFNNNISKAGRQISFLNTAIKDHFNKLHIVYKKLNAIDDITAEDIANSKKLFEKEIRPALTEMNMLLDLLNYKDMLKAEGKTAEAEKVRIWEHAPALLKEGQLPKLKTTLADYRKKYSFFNYEIEFPEAFAGTNSNRGFHIIVGNPPWDKTKFEDPMFFSQYRSNYRTLPNSKKKELQDDLLSKPHICQRYKQEEKQIAALNNYYKLFYPLNRGVGDGNLYRFFVERNLGLLAEHGTLNYVLPTALLTDDGSTTLRKAIFEKYTINSFDGFENNKKIFPDVDSRYKFGLLQIQNTKNEQQKACMRFMQVDPAVLQTDEESFDYSLDDIQATSPEFMAYMEVKFGRADLDVLSRIYTKFPALKPEWIDFRRELDATNDKSIFLGNYQDGYFPLYKGASIWQYDSRYGKPEYWLDPDEFDDYLSNRETSRLIDDVYPSLPEQKGKTQEQTVLKALGLHKREELGQFVMPDRLYYKLGYRDIARDTDERTLICSLLPKNIGAQNKLILSIPKHYVFLAETKTIGVEEIPIGRLLFIQALFNSIAVDWCLRFSIAITVSKSILMRQPMPQPDDAQLTTNPIYKEMILNSLKLSLYHYKDGFSDLQMLYDLKDADIPKTPKQVDMLKIRNDVLVAGLYDISKAEMEQMLKSFKVLKNKKPEYVASLLAAM